MRTRLSFAVFFISVTTLTNIGMVEDDRWPMAGCFHLCRVLVSGCLNGAAGPAAGQGGLPERQDSGPGVQAAAASRAAEDDHREGDGHLLRSQTGHQQGAW